MQSHCTSALFGSTQVNSFVSRNKYWITDTTTLSSYMHCHQQSAIAASLFRVCIINGSFNEGAYQDVLVNSGCLPSYDTKFLTATGNPITIPGQTHSPPSLKSHYLSSVANCTRHTCKLSLITWVSELMGHLAQTLV